MKLYAVTQCHYENSKFSGDFVGEPIALDAASLVIYCISFAVKFYY